jgi:phage shock protein A
MGFFTRLSDIISANLNSLLDKAENPQATIRQIIREMEEGVAGAKRSAATAIAAEKRLKHELDEYRRQSDFWQTKAREAVEAGRDDLARRALARRREIQDLLRGLEQQHEDSVATSMSLKTTLRALEARLAEARRKHHYLTAQRAAIDAQKQLNGSVGIDFKTTRDTMRRFDRLDEEILEAEAEAAALTEVNRTLGGLEAEFADLEAQAMDVAIDAELESLKREVRDQAPPP